MKGLQRKHWLVHVLKRAGTSGAEDLDIDPGTPVAEAWIRVCDTAGMTQDQLAQHVADYFRLKVAALDKAEPTAIKLVPEKVARLYSIYPLREDDRQLTVATSDPTNFSAEQALGFISGRKAAFEVAPPAFILDAINESYRADGVVEALVSWVDSQEAMILVVDDAPEDRLLVRTVLQKYGFRVAEARDGAEALEQIGMGDGHALIVLDLEMPTMDGRETLQRLRASGATVGLPVIVLTGSPDPEDECSLMEAGADDYLRKPLDPPRFIARVKAALRRARMA